MQTDANIDAFGHALNFFPLSLFPLLSSSFLQPSTMNPPIWQEARNAEGRAYYYNVQTKATQWQKPAELMTPVEVCDPNHHLLEL